MAFNGGKMPHIFVFDRDSKPPVYTDQFHSEEAAKALELGSFFVKIDGSNGMLHLVSNDQAVTCYQRRDTKGKPFPPGSIPLPDARNEATYEGHSYCYEPILRDVIGKKLQKRNAAILDLVERHREYLLSLNAKEWISVEWIGRQFNRTPGVPEEVGLAIHAQQRVEVDFPRTYDGLRDYLGTTAIEGLIVEHEGYYWKVRSDCFDRPSPFRENRESVPPPTYLS